MRHLGSALFVSTLVFALAPQARAADGDVVFLANGGRIRGTVVQEDPVQGVRIRLADGTVRNLAAKEVTRVQYGGEPPAVAAPAAPVVTASPVTPVVPAAPVTPVVPAAPVTPVVPVPPPPSAQESAGSIHVEAAAPASVTVDGGLVGKAPADVKTAGVGRHLVHVDFDDGGSREQIVLVQGGETTNVRLALPETREIFASHKGIHFGFSAELALNHFLSGPDATLFGAGGAFVFDYGASPGVDLRATAFADVTGGTFAFLPFGGSLGIHFNAGSTYTIALGVRGGVGVIAGSNGSTPGPFFGPELSLLGFRFGDRREYSIELTQRLPYYSFSGASAVSFENAITLTYLFLGAP